MTIKYPDYLVAVDYKNDRIFVLAKPNLCALRTQGVWEYIMPLSDEEIERYELITDIVKTEKIVKEAKEALSYLGVK